MIDKEQEDAMDAHTAWLDSQNPISYIEFQAGYLTRSEIAAKREAELLARIAELEAIANNQKTRIEALYDGTESTPALVKISRLEAEIERLKAGVNTLTAWRDKAFQAHPNIDIDIEHISPQPSQEKGNE